MTSSRRNLLLGLCLLLAAGLALALAWGLREPDVAPPAPIESLPSAPAPAAPAEPAPDSERSDLASAPEADPAEDLYTTVIHPLKIDLELVRSSFTLQAAETAPLGSGATARFSGSVHATGSRPVRVEVQFVSGPNAGRVLYSDREGTFGANDLYPGLSLVRVVGAGIPGSEREVRLRQERDTQLNLGYARLAVVHGSVRDREGQPITGALVRMDGQETVTDEFGEFIYTGMTPGDVIVTAAKEGFAALRQQITVVGATTIEKGKLVLTLEKAGRLELSIADRIGTDSPAQVFLLPENLEGERKFPWHSINPKAVYPGGTVTIEDLPTGTIEVRLYHSGATAKPRSKRVRIVAGETSHETFQLEKARSVAGIVRQGGKPVSGATVRLEAPDRVAAMNATIGGDYLALERELLPNLPPAVQETQTNVLGEFVLSANEDVSKQRYLVAVSSDGRSRGGVVLSGGEERVDVALEPLAAGEGVLVLQIDGRFQPLPVEITVNGTPRDLRMLPPGRDLTIEGLTLGSWKLNARWSSEELQKDMPIELDREVSLSLTVPEGALFGQDDETRKRAGKK